MNYLYADSTASMIINGKRIYITNKYIINSLIADGVQFTCFTADIQKNSYITHSPNGKHTNTVSFIYKVTHQDGREEVCLGMTAEYCQSVFGTYSASVFQSVKRHGHCGGIRVEKMFADSVRRTTYENVKQEYTMRAVHCPQELPEKAEAEC